MCSAFRAACPGVRINLTAGVIGKDISGPAACIRRVKPEIAACTSGTPCDADLLSLLPRWMPAGREIAAPDEARARLGLTPQPA